MGLDRIPFNHYYSVEPNEAQATIDKILQEQLAAAAFDIATASRSHIPSTCSFYRTRFMLSDFAKYLSTSGWPATPPSPL